MKKAENVKEFVERIDNAKKKNPKDLSSDQDLTIAIMNLISIEEHLIFSGAKTGKNTFYDMVQEIREMRKNLMLKVTHCILLLSIEKIKKKLIIKFKNFLSAGIFQD